MTALSIYEYNLANSKEFLSLDAFYHVISKSQEEKWDLWWDFAKDLPAKDTLKLQKKVIMFSGGQLMTVLFRPAIDGKGLIIGNPVSFLVSYHRGETDFFDIVN
jgi:hypothetical protein